MRGVGGCAGRGDCDEVHKTPGPWPREFGEHCDHSMVMGGNLGVHFVGAKGFENEKNGDVQRGSHVSQHSRLLYNYNTDTEITEPKSQVQYSQALLQGLGKANSTKKLARPKGGGSSLVDAAAGQEANQEACGDIPEVVDAHFVPIQNNLQNVQARGCFREGASTKHFSLCPDEP